MDKMKRFIDCYIPTETCNFRCHYCYIAQKRKYNNKLMKLTHTPEEISTALSKKRLGGVCMFNLCAGGETLLSDEVITLIRLLLEEGHYVMVVTNGSLKKRFDEIALFPKKLLNHLFFKFSFHYLELVRLNMLDIFSNNVMKMKEAGASFTIEITPTDELEPYIDEIKEYSIKKFGALPHITVGRKDVNNIPILTEHSIEEYKKIWSTFDSDLFSFKMDIFGKKIKNFCYAGEFSAYLNIESGNLVQCYCGRKIDNIYDNIKKPIKFCAVGNNCKLPHCYNGHAFLSFGDVPELDTPTYDKLRNRKCNDGTYWLTKDMQQFMSNKLYNNNKLFSSGEKRKVNINNKVQRLINLPKKVYNKIKKV